MLSRDDHSRATILSGYYVLPSLSDHLGGMDPPIYFSIVLTRSFAGATLVGGANPISVAVTYA